MQEIYPVGTRSALEVFQIYEEQGNFFDIRDPSHIQRGTFSLGEEKKIQVILLRINASFSFKTKLGLIKEVVCIVAMVSPSVLFRLSSGSFLSLSCFLLCTWEQEICELFSQFEV